MHLDLDLYKMSMGFVGRIVAMSSCKYLDEQLSSAPRN